MGSSFVDKPETINAAHIIPIDFCASLPPCPRLRIDDDSSCNLLKTLSTPEGVDLRRKFTIMLEMIYDISIPGTGAINMNETTFMTPVNTIEDITCV